MCSEMKAIEQCLSFEIPLFILYKVALVEARSCSGHLAGLAMTLWDLRYGKIKRPQGVHNG